MTMKITAEQAYRILELPLGADKDAIKNQYKKLAVKWHPDKHKNSPESIKKFLEVSASFKRLTERESTKNDITLSVEEMFDLFKATFRPPSNSAAYAGYSSSDSEDEDGYNSKNNFITVSKSQSGKKKDLKAGEKNIDLDAKTKAEKRRLKKKRRKEKKKLEKQNADDDEDEDQNHTRLEIPSADHILSNNSLGRDHSPGEGDEFDPNAAFVMQVRNKQKKGQDNLPTGKKEKVKDRILGGASGKQNYDDDEDLDPITKRSRELAIKGNDLAKNGRYQEAIQKFSEAIEYDGTDYRFFGNRSYCYDNMRQYDKALKDADEAIRLAPDWAKGYFRRGRALAGLKLNADAEKAFLEVLKRDKNCEPAVQELMAVRCDQLIEMGFTKQQADAAIQEYGTVQAALDALLAGVAESSFTNSEEVYQSDDEIDLTEVNFTNQLMYQAQRTQNNGADVKMDPANPEALKALWVGNVLPEVTEKQLQKMFSKFGKIVSIRLLPEKYCCFVNYENPGAAGEAMRHLQGIECAGQSLLIKFPDHPITHNGNVVIKKGTPAIPSNYQQQVLTQNAAKKGVHNVPKLTGPVNGDECYFWRTTGCMYADKCHFKHPNESRGIDKKPWQKVK